MDGYGKDAQYSKAAVFAWASLARLPKCAHLLVASDAILACPDDFRRLDAILQHVAFELVGTESVELDAQVVWHR